MPAAADDARAGNRSLGRDPSRNREPASLFSLFYTFDRFRRADARRRWRDAAATVQASGWSRTSSCRHNRFGCCRTGGRPRPGSVGAARVEAKPVRSTSIEAGRDAARSAAGDPPARRRAAVAMVVAHKKAAPDCSGAAVLVDRCWSVAWAQAPGRPAHRLLEAVTAPTPIAVGSLSWIHRLRRPSLVVVSPTLPTCNEAFRKVSVIAVR